MGVGTLAEIRGGKIFPAYVPVGILDRRDQSEKQRESPKENRVKAGTFVFVTKGEKKYVEWHPTNTQLQLVAELHQHIMTGNMKDSEFAATTFPIHEQYRNADSCQEMSRTDNLGYGNCLSPNVHILDVHRNLRTNHLFQFYPTEEAELHVMAIRLATLHHDDGKTLGTTDVEHPVTSIQMLRAIVKKLTNLGICSYPPAVMETAEKLIRTHHAFQAFPNLVYSRNLAKLQKGLIDTMRKEAGTTKDGKLGKKARTRHYPLLTLLLQDEVNKALDLHLWLEKFPEFTDPTFAHLALVLNEADLMASECLQFLITVNRIVLVQLLAEEVANSAETHFFPPYR